MRTRAAILDDIERYEPSGSWLGLETLLTELFSHDIESVQIEPLLRIFERFPDEDGFGVFWSVVHGIEAIGGYEQQLIESILRRPNLFNVIMAQRVLQSSPSDSARLGILEAFGVISSERQIAESLKADVQELIEQFS